MGAGPSVASSVPTGLADLTAGAIFSLGMAVGAAWSAVDKLADTLTDAAFDALDAVDTAAVAVAEYLREVMAAAWSAVAGAAAWALEKLEKAAALVVDMVVRLFRRLFGRQKAAAAKREMRRAGPEAPDVFAEAAARVARSERRIMGPEAPSSAAVVVVPAAAAAEPGALALVESVSRSAVARRAARSSAGMMGFILEAVAAEADVGARIPAAARSNIAVIAAAAAACLGAVAATDAKA